MNENTQLKQTNLNFFSSSTAISIKREFKNLVFEGGGVKGLGYVGALQVLHEHDYLSGIEQVAGTSAGAITALLVGLSYGLDEIEQEMTAMDLNAFQDGPIGAIPQFFKAFFAKDKKMGVHPGTALEEWFKKLIEQKLAKPHATFADLHLAVQQQGLENQNAFRFRDIHVIGTNLSQGRQETFSYYTTPEMPLWVAIRISMSIPLFFEPKIYLKDEKGQFIYNKKTGLPIEDSNAGEMYVDGGLINNYPVKLFDDGFANLYTLGLRVDSPDEIQILRDNVYFSGDVITDYKKYGKAIINSACSAQNMGLKDDDFRTIYINIGEIKSTQFNLNEDEKAFLIRSGKTAVTNYLYLIHENSHAKRSKGHDIARLNKLDRWKVYSHCNLLCVSSDYRRVQCIFETKEGEDWVNLQERLEKYFDRLKKHSGIFSICHERRLTKGTDQVLTLVLSEELAEEIKKFIEKHHNKLSVTEGLKFISESQEYLLIANHIFQNRAPWMICSGKGQKQESALFDAVSKCNFKKVAQLLDEGVSPACRNDKHNNLLHEAVKTGNAALMNLLIEKGVSLQEQNAYGDYPLHCAVFKMTQMDPQAKGLLFLLEKGALVNVQNKQGQTPLLLAASWGYLDAVKYLLSHGADPSVPDKEGKMALDKAREYGYQDVIALLELNSNQVLQERALSPLSKVNI